MISKLDHVNITVRSLEESVAWYRKIFGFRLVESGTSVYGRKWGIVESGDTMICMTEWPKRVPTERADEDAGHRIYHFGLRVADAEKWRETLAANELRLFYGGEVQYPRSRSWYIHDPSGHEIEVSHASGTMFD